MQVIALDRRSFGPVPRGQAGTTLLPVLIMRDCRLSQQGKTSTMDLEHLIQTCIVCIVSSSMCILIHQS